MKDYQKKKKKGTEEKQEKTKTTWIVSSSRTSKTGERVWDKRHFCFYCERPFKKISEHWDDMHSEESEVSEIFALEKKSKARRDLIAKLRKAGDYEHNKRVLEGNEKGELIVHKRPKYGDKHTFNQYMFCSDCRGLYKKTALYRHKEQCPSHKPNKKRSRHLRAGAALMPTSTNTSESVQVNN